MHRGKQDTYQAALKYALETARQTGRSYFVYQDFDEYQTRKQWKIISEAMYHECFCLPENWVAAFIGPTGIIETY